MARTKYEDQKNRKKKLKQNEEKFIAEYLTNNQNAAAAARSLGTTSNDASAARLGSYYKDKLKDEIELRMAKFGLKEEIVIKRHKDIIENGSDNVAMEGIKEYYKQTAKSQEQDGNITINLNF